MVKMSLNFKRKYGIIDSYQFADKVNLPTEQGVCHVTENPDLSVWGLKVILIKNPSAELLTSNKLIFSYGEKSEHEEVLWNLLFKSQEQGIEFCRKKMKLLILSPEYQLV